MIQELTNSHNGTVNKHSKVPKGFDKCKYNEILNSSIINSKDINNDLISIMKYLILLLWIVKKLIMIL